MNEAGISSIFFLSKILEDDYKKQLENDLIEDRIEIRNLILKGEIKNAIDKINEVCPNVFLIYKGLVITRRCQRFEI